jgi:hypothetical protein
MENPMGLKAETLEWLGLKPADFIVALAAVSGLAMFYVGNTIGSVVLGIAPIVLTVVACPIGMRHDPEVSDFTNGTKIVAYPLCVLLAVVACLYRFGWI